MRLPKLSRSCAAEVGKAGKPNRPYAQSKTTRAIKKIFHFRLGFMNSVLVSHRDGYGLGSK